MSQKPKCVSCGKEVEPATDVNGPLPSDNLTCWHCYHGKKSEEALQAGAGPTVATADTSPTLHPFNLARALAGEGVRTRSGKRARNYGPCGKDALFSKAEYPYEAEIDGIAVKQQFTNEGKLYSTRNVDDDLDLFMASEAAEGKCSRCRGAKLVCDNDGQDMIPCPECSRQAPPSPKSEAQGQDRAKALETAEEFERRAHVMREAGSAGVILVARKLYIQDSEYRPIQNPTWDWHNYDYQLRLQSPAPEKARRVWVNRHGNDDALTAFWSAAAAKEDKRYTNRKETIELIELTPAIRAEINAVLEALCQFANATASGLVLREVEHEAQTLLTKLPAIRAAVEREGL